MDDVMSEQSTEQPLRAALDRELAKLKDDVLQLGEMTSEAIARAMESLLNRDTVLAQDVVNDDAAINAKRFDIEEESLSLIATQQPAAGDLRAVVAAMNMVGDLERMGDHAAGTATIVLRMEEEEQIEIPPGLSSMFEKTIEMLQQALSAYAQDDAAMAHQVASMDDEIDIIYKKLFRDLIEFIAEHPQMTTGGLYLLFAGHNLERIADRSTNLAERVVFLGSGRMQELNPESDEAGLN
ncbi:MAG: phosphate signaling complex protein PhoU [Anaerolineales bacterium]|jgi:phosphate transport system protein|nr:MAG: phosphate signaling complex protein PhoU [Anaerolineales bacterium]